MTQLRQAAADTGDDAQAPQPSGGEEEHAAPPPLSRSPVGTAGELAMPAAMSATTVMRHSARWAPRVR